MADERTVPGAGAPKDSLISSAGEEAPPEGRRLPRDVAWPELPYHAWKSTLETLHRWTQVVGKMRLAQAPFEPEWQNVPLLVTARGLTTGPIPYGDVAFEAAFDFIDHELVLAASDGNLRRLPLGPRSVADFYRDALSALDEMGISLSVSDVEVEIPNPAPFSEDVTHSSYEPEPVQRFFRVISRVDQVLKRWRAGFRGRTTPVSFWWGTFDLTVTRFSGRPADPPPASERILRYAMDAEEVAGGFWPGDERYPRPAFFAYVYPKPHGFEHARFRPGAAGWSDSLREVLLPYDDARAAPDPEAAILELLDSTYEAGAALAGWDRAALDLRDAPPPPRRSPRPARAA